MKEDASKFVNACISKGEGEESGDTRHDRKYWRIINKIYVRLKSEHRLSELLELLEHENPYVRLWAACYTLQIDETKAVTALEELAATQKLMAGFSASITLKEWRAGRLNVE